MAITRRDHEKRHQQGEPGQTEESTRDSINENATRDRVVTMWSNGFKVGEMTGRRNIYIQEITCVFSKKVL